MSDFEIFKQSSKTQQQMRSKYSRQKSSKFTDLVRNVKKSKFLVSVAVLALISTQNLVLSQEQFDEQDLPIDLLNSDNLNIDNNKWSLDEYKYLSYKEMRTRMYQLQEKYPNIMEIETSEEMFDIGHEAFCGNEVVQKMENIMQKKQINQENGLTMEFCNKFSSFYLNHQ